MAEYSEPRRRQVDPLAVATEAVHASLRGADSVVEVLSEGLRGRVGPRFAGAASGRKRAAKTRAKRARSRYGRTTPPGRGGPPPPATGGTADLFAALLERFGEAIEDIGAVIAEHEWFEREPEGPTLELHGPPGNWAPVEFAFTNTGESVLTRVMFEPTDLLGATDRIDAGLVRFRYEGDDQYIPRVGPGGRARVILAVKIPEEAPAGYYRGVIAARSAPPEGRGEDEGGPEDAWALIELEVGATDPRSAITQVERAQEE